MTAAGKYASEATLKESAMNCAVPPEIKNSRVPSGKTVRIGPGRGAAAQK